MEATATGLIAQRQPLPEPQSATNALSSDFETFLRMLTIQMKNQDPLNPIESSDFAVQLATFSGVEQQVRTNTLLARLADGLAASGMTDFAGWIGREVRTAAPALFDGSPLTLHPGEGAPASGFGFLVVREETGLPVARSAIPLDGQPLVWAGVRPDGTPFPPGLYRFEIELVDGQDIVGTAPVEHYARVSEVRSGSDGAILLLDGGATAPVSSVTAVRDGAG